MSPLGRTIGPYRITEPLGEGGMGAVYRATDNIEREVAIKVLAPQLLLDAGQTARFRAEAKALGRLHHPNITSLFQLLETDEGTFLVMELVEGHTLDELIRTRGPMAPQLALALLIEALHGLEHAHARGVIHRDIKASNLMISNEGTLKIMDFGIARIDGSARLTKTSRPIGTLAYMSPEQVNGREIDARSDAYSLGVLGFELLTGRVPFNDDTDFELMRSHLEKTPPSMRFLVPSLPAELDEVLGKALAKAPQDRFQSAAEMREALEKVAAKLPANSNLAAPISTPISPPGATTPIPVSKKRGATLADIAPEPEDRYATRLVGTPMPAAPMPAAPVPAAPPAPVPIPATVPAQKPVAPRRAFASFAAGGTAFVVVLLLAAAKFWPGARQSTTPARVPTSHLAIAPQAVRHNAPKRAVAAKKHEPRRLTRRGRPKLRTATRTATRTAPRRIVRAAEVTRPVRALRRHIAVSRPAVRRAPLRRDEGAALRAIIKGQ